MLATVLIYKPQSQQVTTGQVRHVLVTISSSYRRHYKNFSPGNNIQMQSEYEKPATTSLFKLIVGVTTEAYISCRTSMENQKLAFGRMV